MGVCFACYANYRIGYRGSRRKANTDLESSIAVLEECIAEIERYETMVEARGLDKGRRLTDGKEGARMKGVKVLREDVAESKEE